MSEQISQERTIKKVTRKEESKVIFIKFADNFECRCFKDQQFGAQLEEGVTALCITEQKDNGQGGTANYLKQWGEPVQKQKPPRQSFGHQGKSPEEIRSIAFQSIFRTIVEAHERDEDVLDIDLIRAETEKVLRHHDSYVYRGASSSPPLVTQEQGERILAQATSHKPQATSQSSPPPTSAKRSAFGHTPEGWAGPNAFGSQQSASQVKMLEGKAKERGVPIDEIPALRKAVLDAYGIGTEYTQGHASIFIEFLMHASDEALAKARQKAAA